MTDQRVSIDRQASREDVEEILRLNREWWESNIGWDIPRMVKVFPSPGNDYLMFNFNGHPYFGMGEKVRLWEWYSDLIAQTKLHDLRIMRLEVRGDMAWLACEAWIEAKLLTDGEWTADSIGDAAYARATEIYHRDDGAGKPVWRMWHTHISPLPELSEKRPGGFEDSTVSRGLGWAPWNPFPKQEA
ncbi:ketosteroid isomerase-like protein [Mesorhizobium soli]|uniref:nuclear transport factor 2 family protein n=1 Tax=Pseudaminobacter soli (ex Li et al. 2025) TaxID=1295366 RepID=UPI0024764546|nr:nuclear transport factor 2 family protein [Mesorhizobium soli]MDH6233755.1 ketosteroid isomerase-like protein [Mesorhizobium soli]